MNAFLLVLIFFYDSLHLIVNILFYVIYLTTNTVTTRHDIFCFHSITKDQMITSIQIEKYTLSLLEVLNIHFISFTEYENRYYI